MMRIHGLDLFEQGQDPQKSELAISVGRVTSMGSSSATPTLTLLPFDENQRDGQRHDHHYRRDGER
jgi:hypothetical protein